jgi:hypothetical protein
MEDIAASGVQELYFKYDPNHICPHFMLSEDRLTVNDTAGVDRFGARGDTPISLQGTTRFEFRIVEAEMLAIGVCTDQENMGQGVGSTVESWGYLGFGILGHDNNWEKMYGKEYGNGDKVTVIVDREAGTIEYEVNGDKQGIAFTEEKLK